MPSALDVKGGWGHKKWMPTWASLARAVGTVSLSVFGFLAALVGPPVYEAWKTNESLDALITELGGHQTVLIWLVVTGVLWLLLLALESYLRSKTDRSLINERLLLNQFGAIVQRMADGVRLPNGKRKDEAGTVLLKVLHALEASYKNIEDARAVFYLLNHDKTELTPIESVGERRPRGAFKESTKRGSDALTFVNNNPAGHSELIRDTTKESREGWSGSGNGYRTYISTVVGNEDGPIGMLSIDAKNQNSLSAADKRYASLAAGLLAIAYTPLR